MNIRYPIYEGVYRILTTHQYSLFLSVGKTGRLDKGRLYGCAIGQDFQSRSRLHTIFASENDDDFGGKLF